VYGEGDQRDDRGADGDQNGPQAHDSRIEHGLLEGLASGMHLLNEIKEDDDVADDYTN
jgi:hypothetical protein